MKLEGSMEMESLHMFVRLQKNTPLYLEWMIGVRSPVYLTLQCALQRNASVSPTAKP